MLADQIGKMGIYSALLTFLALTGHLLIDGTYPVFSL